MSKNKVVTADPWPYPPSGTLDAERNEAWIRRNQECITAPSLGQWAVARLICKRCPTDAIGMVWRCRHHNDDEHLFAEMLRMTTGKMYRPVRILLDREPPDAIITADCVRRSHGSAQLTILELSALMKAKEPAAREYESAAQRSRRARGCLVLSLGCTPCMV